MSYWQSSFSRQFKERHCQLISSVRATLMMTSSNGNTFRVTGPLCGELTGPGEFPTQRPVTRSMLCTAQLPGPVLKAFGKVQFSPLQLADKSPMITDQHTAGGPVSQLSQLAKLSPWLTLSTKDITTLFWHHKKLFCFLSNQIMGLYHFSNPTELNLCIYGEKLCIYGEK